MKEFTTLSPVLKKEVGVGAESKGNNFIHTKNKEKQTVNIYVHKYR